MIKFTVSSYIGVGPIEFGATRGEIVELIGPPDGTLFYPGGTLAAKDIYNKLCCHVLYGEDQCCNSVEFHTDAIVEFEGRNFLRSSFQDTIEWIRHRGYSIDNLDNFGFRSMEVGIAIYAPGCLQDPEEPVEAFMAFGHREFA